MDLENMQRLWKAISKTYQIGVFYFDNDVTMIYSSVEKKEQLLAFKLNDIILKATECLLFKKARIMIENNGIAWIGIPVMDEDTLKGVVLLGAFRAYNIPDQELVESIRNIYIEEEQVQFMFQYILRLPFYNDNEYITIIKLLYNYLYQSEFNMNELQAHDETIELNSSLTDYSSSQINSNHLEFHGTHEAEKYLLECIKTGDVERIKSSSISLKGGKLGSISIGNELRQAKNIFIVSTTIATRAAIEVGVNSELAYTISDIYIRQSESLSSITKIYELQYKMLYDLTRRVKELVGIREQTPYISRTCEYIKAHVYEDIKLPEIANDLGISTSHLSRIFHNEMGINVVNYIRNVKVNEAKFLLKFTDYSYVEISDKLAFSSQSYFITVFKNIAGVTPKQYKINYKAKE